jgi:predicted nucleotidyltransferase
MTPLQEALIRLEADLRALRIRWALVGGFALNVYVEPRTTLDIDFAVAVSSDAQAEGLVRSLHDRGYTDNPEGALLEQTDVGRLATSRLISPVGSPAGCAVDLLFASSGIEAEIVADAILMQLFRGFEVLVARPGHLLATKVLAGRSQDRVDAINLLRVIDEAELNEARAALNVIQRRGYHRGRDGLAKELALLLAEAK